MRSLARLVGTERLDVELDVGRRKFGPRLQESRPLLIVLPVVLNTGRA